MNSLLTQASPSRRGSNRGGGGSNGSGATRGGSTRRRRRRGGSKLASSNPSILTSSPLANGDGTSTETEEESSDEVQSTTRQERFGKTDPGNQYERLKVEREVERKQAIAKGLIADPDKPRNLTEAIRFVGTCPDMCPEFEMHQREYQNNVAEWEKDPTTGRIDKSRAVKAFHRPAAGNEQPLPSDVRPPAVLVKTLDYLFSTILEGGEDIYATHAFIRDRTRSIRQDFTVQNYRGKEAIECHERIARYHILCLHALCDNPNFSEQQEMEQLRKVLQSLMEFYKDTHMSTSPLPLPNEAEFRAYYALIFLRDNDVSRQLEMLPENIFTSSALTRSLRLRGLAQKSNDKFVQNNAEAAPNSFARFFKEVQRSTTYLEACILETWFGSIRTGALKALRQALGVKASQVSQVSVPILVRLLGLDDVDQFVALCDHLGLDLITDENGARAVWFKRNVVWEEPASYLHQFSRTIVEEKRKGLSNQAFVNGAVPPKQVDRIRPSTNRTWVNKDIGKQAPPTAFTGFSLAVNGAHHVVAKQSMPAFTPQPPIQQPNLQPLPQIQPTPPQIQRQFDQANVDLTAPVPIRAKKSPILKFQPTAPAFNITQQAPQIQELPKFSMPFNKKLFEPSALSVATEAKPSLTTTAQMNVNRRDDAPTVVLGQPPIPTFQEKSSSDAERNNRRQSLFEQQEKLLHEQLALQERERQAKLDLAIHEQETAEQIAQKLVLERQLLRQKEASLLEAEKLASIKREERQQALNEKRKAQREKMIQFYATEVVNSIVQEHVLELNATVLAVEFHRKKLLHRVIRKIRKVGARSVLRKQIQLEEIAQAKMRKNLLTRARAELDSTQIPVVSKKVRRRSRLQPLEDEDAFDQMLVKASEEAKELWRPMDANQILTPYIDGALARAGRFQVEWNLLMLSMNNDSTEETRWLRTKFGFVNETDDRIRLASDVAEVNVIWSSVMQFSGSLVNVGALIFVYEGPAQGAEPDVQALLHEIVRQTSLQSRYQYPVLIINFNENSTNASEVARDLDLQTLSKLTTSVPAFQVLTIGALGEANLDASVRSFIRHVSGAVNGSMDDSEKEKKRKREVSKSSVEPPSLSHAPHGTNGTHSLPAKRIRNQEDHSEERPDSGSQKLPKSIESLYASIMSAEKELEAGRDWS